MERSRIIWPVAIASRHWSSLSLPTKPEKQWKNCTTRLSMVGKCKSISLVGTFKHISWPSPWISLMILTGYGRLGPAGRLIWSTIMKIGHMRTVGVVICTITIKRRPGQRHRQFHLNYCERTAAVAVAIVAAATAMVHHILIVNDHHLHQHHRPYR